MYIIVGAHLEHVVSVFLDQLQSGLVGSVDELSDLLVDQLCRSLTVWLLKHSVPLLRKVKGHLANQGVHPKLCNL